METVLEFETLKKWKRPDSYIGETYEDFYACVGRSRDSSIMEEANFQAFLEALGGESSSRGVVVTRASHWAGGWVEQILVHEEADPELLLKADEMLTTMADYPVLDEGLMYEMESEAEHKDFEESVHEELCKLWEADPENYKLPEGYDVWELPLMVGDTKRSWTSSIGGHYASKADALWWLVFDLNETLDSDDEQDIECPYAQQMDKSYSAYSTAMDKTNQCWYEDSYPDTDKLYPIWRDELKGQEPVLVYNPPKLQYEFAAI